MNVLILGLALALLCTSFTAERLRPGSHLLTNACALFAAAALASSSLLTLTAGLRVGEVPADGLALLGLAALYALLAGTSFGGGESRNLATVLGACALVAGGAGLVLALSGPVLGISIALIAALLASLADHLQEPRAQMAALVALIFGIAFALIVRAPLTEMFYGQDPGQDLTSVLAAALAASSIAWLARLDAADDGDWFDVGMAHLQWRLRSVLLWVAILLACYGAILTSLLLFTLFAGEHLSRPTRLGALGFSLVMIFFGSFLYRRFSGRLLGYDSLLAD